MADTIQRTVLPTNVVVPLSKRTEDRRHQPVRRVHPRKARQTPASLAGADATASPESPDPSIGRKLNVSV